MIQFNHDHYFSKRKISLLEKNLKSYSINGDSLIFIKNDSSLQNYNYDIFNKSQLVFLFSNIDENWSYNNIHINIHEDCDLFFLNSPKNTKIKNKIIINVLNEANINIRFLSHIQKNQIQDDSIEVIHSSKVKTNIIYDSFVYGELISQVNSFIPHSSFDSETHQKLTHIMLEGAKISSRPNLDINNKNTIASHGNTISPIKSDILFYLNQRGISLKNAQDIIQKEQLNYFISLIKDNSIQKDVGEHYVR